MAYPEQSNFRTAGRNAWWELTLSDGARRRCQMPGYLFIRSVQRTIQQRVPANAPTYQGTISGSSITVDGRIGTNTIKGLYALLRAMNAPAQMLQDVSDEGTAVRSGVNAVNGDTIRAMIWATAESARVNPAEIILPPGTVLPLWNTAPATDITEPACSLISAPPGADTTPPQPGEVPPNDTWTPPGETWTPPKTGETWGKDLAPDGTKPIEKILEDLDKPGTPGSKDALTLALEQITADLPTTPIEAGLSTGTMVAIGVGAVAVIALIAVVAMRSGKASGGTRRRRRNPSKRRAR